MATEKQKGSEPVEQIREPEFIIELSQLEIAAIQNLRQAVAEINEKMQSAIPEVARNRGMENLEKFDLHLNLSDFKIRAYHKGEAIKE